MFKKILFGILKYVVVMIVLLAPMFLFILSFDFIVDFEINFFEKYSFARLLFFIWFWTINIAYIVTEHKEFIKKYII